MYIRDKITKYGGGNRIAFLEAIIRCEGGNLNPDIQSGIRDSSGQLEDSWGIVQIHLPSHPTITKEQATNPDFAIAFLVEQVNLGHEDMWTCARKIKARHP